MDPNNDVSRDPNLPVIYADGLPIPTGKRQATGREIMESMTNALSSEYSGSDARKKGLTKYEAMLLSLSERAQEGDLHAIESILDRILGRPIQQVNSMNVSATLHEFLDTLDNTARKCETIEPLPWD